MRRRARQANERWPDESAVSPKPGGRLRVLLGIMATLLPDLAVLDCRIAALALAAGRVALGEHLLSRAAMLLRIRAVEPNIGRPHPASFDC
jgi:hypothetical protein